MLTGFLAIPAAGAFVPVPGAACDAVSGAAPCASWTRLAQGLDLCGVSGEMVLTTPEDWAAFVEMAGPCFPEEMPEIDFGTQFVVFVAVPHIDCCDHRTDVVSVVAGAAGYNLTYLHVTGWGGWDSLTAPYDLIVVDRAMGVPTEVSFTRVDATLPPVPPLP